MSALDELISRRRQQRDTVFLAFDFFWYTYDHEMEWWSVGEMECWSDMALD
jgi:hypothetical protein